MTSIPCVTATALTNIGRLRDTHEDAIGVGRQVSVSTADSPVVFSQPLIEPFVCVVADGLGGHRAGHVASRHVVERFVQDATHLHDENSLASFLCQLNDELFRLMDQDGDLRGMGTTVAGLLVTCNDVTFFNVGDSRAYREQDGFLRQLSVDDSRVDATAPDAGRVLTQSLGGTALRTAIEPHIGSERTIVDRRYLLCTDGLSDMLDLDDIEACLSADDRESVSSLLERAMTAGGVDNISIILVRIGSEHRETLPAVPEEIG